MKIIKLPIVSEVDEAVIIAQRDFPNFEEQEEQAAHLVQYIRDNVSAYTWDCIAKKFNEYWKLDDHSED